MHEYPYRTCAEIDLNKLQRNLQRLRALIGPDCRIMEVMKADAYGHGLRVCAEYAAPYVDWFAAATLEEALAVRAAAPHTPILIFGGLLDPEIIQAAQHGLTINVFSLQYASHVQALLQPMDLQIDVHIKVDTGMNRLGLHAHALGHVGGAYGAIGVDGPGHALIRTGTGRKFSASGLQCRQQIGLIHHVQKVGVILFAVLVHGLIVVNDDIECIAAAGLDGDKLLVGVLVIEQIAGDKVALVRKAYPRLGGGGRLLQPFPLVGRLDVLVTAPGMGRHGKAAHEHGHAERQ